MRLYSNTYFIYRGSPLAAAELKEKMKIASIALIKEKVTHTVADARTTFYSLALKDTENLFRCQLQLQPPERGLVFSYLFSPSIAKFHDSELEYQVQTILDSELPGLVDVFNLSDDMLKLLSEKSFCNDEQNNIPIDTWFIEDKDYTCELSLEKLESRKDNFSKVCDKLNVLNLTPDWAFILKDTIEKRLNVLAWKDNWSTSMVPVHLKWLHVLILPWISYVTPKTEDIDANWNSFLREKIKAEHVLYEMIYQSRIPDIFDIIREYPSTKNAILDFHVVATKRGLLDGLKNKLLQELQGRLLQQGASATDILQQYIACIQCLSIIDPSCGIMVPIIETIEHYMKSYRKDVVQGVVELIRDQNEDDVFTPAEESDLYVFKQSELNEEEIPKDTVIIKEDKPAELRRLQQKSRDPVAMLISMCSSLKDFIKGYSNKLGEVLLTTKNYDTEEEVRKLELLKRNFPPDTFLRCDIMLKDMDDSRRLDKSIHDSAGIDNNFHAIILSRCYWPWGGDEDDLRETIEEESNLNLSSEQQGIIETYDSEYRRTKASRKLKFLPSLGSVTLELEFQSKVLTVDASPEAVLVLGLFETKDNLFTKEEATVKTGISKEKVVESLEFWMKQEVLMLCANGTYQLVEE
ncbi:unnamed protein product [Mucor hiemalis]